MYGIEIFDDTHFNGNKVEYYETVECFAGGEPDARFMMQHKIKMSKKAKNIPVEMNEVDLEGHVLLAAKTATVKETTPDDDDYDHADDIIDYETQHVNDELLD